MKRLRYVVAAATVLAPSALSAVDVFATSPSELTTYNAETKTLTLSENTSTCLEVGADESYTLDLGGYTLTGGAAGCNTIWVHGGGSLTITGEGTVTNTADSLYPVILNDGGTINITSGTFVSENTTTGRFTPVVDTKIGTTTISGGTFTQKGAYNAIMGEGAGVTNITGGTFTNEAGKYAGVIGNLEDTGSTINISGGTVNAYNNGWTVINFEGNTMSVTGGTFNGLVGQYDVAHPFISGGTFSSDPMVATYYGVTSTEPETYGFIEVNAVVANKVAVEGDGDGGYTIADPAVTLADLEVAAGATTALAPVANFSDATYTYTVTGDLADKVTIDGNNLSVANFALSEAATVTIGVTATATGFSATDTATLTIPANITGITATAAENLTIGETAQITTGITGSYTGEVTYSYAVAEASQDAITVSEAGLIAAKAGYTGDEGPRTVTVTVTGLASGLTFTKDVSLSVAPVSINGITLGSSSLTMNVGGKASTTISYAPSNFAITSVSFVYGSPEDYDSSSYEESPFAYCSVYDSDSSFSSSSSEPSVNYNKLTCRGYAAGSGTVLVTARDVNGNEVTATLNVTVNDALAGANDWDMDEDGNFYGAMVTFENAVEGGSYVEVEAVDAPEAQADNTDLKAVFDITVKDENDNVVSVKDNNVTIVLQISKEQLGGVFKFFQIVYLDVNGLIQEWFDPSDVDYDEENGIYYITVSVPHLSQYGVLASNTAFMSADILNALHAPDTGKFTYTVSDSKNAATGSNFGVVAAAVFSAAVVLAGAAVFTKRK